MIDYTESLNSIKDYLVIYCDRSGIIKAFNDLARNCLSIRNDCNTKYLLDYVLPEYRHIVSKYLNKNTHTNKTYTHVVGLCDQKNYYLLVTNCNNGNQIFSFKDICDTNNGEKYWQNKIIQLEVSMRRANRVLRCVSNICKDVLYKNRSDLEEILLNISQSLELEKSAICFKNGTNHVIYCKKLNDNSYICQKLDGLDNNLCYFNNINQTNDKWQLSNLIKIPCEQCCLFEKEEIKNANNRSIGVVQLALNDKVVGYFQYLPKQESELSDSEMQSIQNLSSVLAYIVNNKEEVRLTIDYINQKFKDLNKE